MLTEIKNMNGNNKESEMNIILGKNIKGKVTKVNQFLLYFEVDKFRIYIQFCNAPAILPCLQDKVEIINTKTFDPATFTAVIGPETNINFPINSSLYYANTLLEFIGKNKIIISEEKLIELNKNIVRKLETFLTDDLVLLCVKSIYKCDLRRTTSESKKNFRPISKTPKDLKYANSTSELYSFLKINELHSFNVYPHGINNNNLEDGPHEYLFGILYVSEMYGYFVLKDDTSQIFVKFMGFHQNLYKFHNSLVMMTKFCVFTEIFQTADQHSLQYMLVNEEDVIIVKPDFEKKKQKLFYRCNELPTKEFKNSYFLEIIKKSEVIYGYNQNPECWMEIVISPEKSFRCSERVCGVLSGKMLTLVPIFKEHKKYKVYTDQTLTYGNADMYRELHKMNELKKLVVFNPDSVFQQIKLSPVLEADKPLEDFNEIKSKIANSDEYKTFSFILKIKMQEFQAKKFRSWFPKRHKNTKYFGDLEHHQQVLMFNDNTSRSYFKLYSSDRENYVYPLGLIDDMTIKVNHVQVNKKKYLNTTVFTRFEIVGYYPELFINCANLSFRDKSVWEWRFQTPPMNLGLYCFVPDNCIVHGKIIFRSVFDFRVRIICLKCRNLIYNEECIRCKIKEYDIDLHMVIVVEDEFNEQFPIDVNCIYFLMQLIGLKREGKDLFVEELLKYGPLTLDFVKIPEDFRLADAESNLFVQKMVTMIRTDINFKCFTMIDVVCIKQKYINKRKPWRLIDYEFC